MVLVLKNIEVLVLVLVLTKKVLFTSLVFVDGIFKIFFIGFYCVKTSKTSNLTDESVWVVYTENLTGA